MTKLNRQSIEYTDKAVSKWERNISYPDVSALPKLAEIFGISVDELMQIKDGNTQKRNNKSIGETVLLVFRAVCLAMGVACAGISLLRETP
ncbi:MAG: helix-turn-helix transcriptional regulator [Lachnospiraceae bacterium]|nr:helix-turn-helix transcriptional regulator [Lachnospiraceae bacterium]